MATLQKTMAFTIAVAIIALSVSSDAEAGRRGGRGNSARRGGSSTHRGTSHSRNNTRMNNSRRGQSFGKQHTPANSTHNTNRFGKMNRGHNTGIGHNNFGNFGKMNRGHKLNTGIGHNNFGNNWNQGQNRVHNNGSRWHGGAFQHHRRNFFVPPTGGFGFNYNYQQATYSNPYCSPVVAGGSAPVYDDSVQLAGEENLVTETDTGKDNFGKGREAFFKGDLDSALPLIEQASKEMPGNPNVQQFRSLVLFAMKDYDKSAAAAYTALTIGPGWNWETLQNLFPSPEIYTSLLRALEEDMGKDQTITSKKFLLAYHYLMLGHKDAAGKQLAPVVKAEPRNDVAKQLLKMIGEKPQAKEAVAPPTPVR